MHVSRLACWTGTADRMMRNLKHAAGAKMRHCLGVCHRPVDRMASAGNLQAADSSKMPPCPFFLVTDRETARSRRRFP